MELQQTIEDLKEGDRLALSKFLKFVEARPAADVLKTRKFWDIVKHVVENLAQECRNLSLRCSLTPLSSFTSASTKRVTLERLLDMQFMLGYISGVWGPKLKNVEIDLLTSQA